MELTNSVQFSFLLKEDLDTFSRWMLTVTEFRGVQYLNIREYFLDFEAEWVPTKKGISVPLELAFTSNLLEGLTVMLKDVDNEV